MMYNIGKSMYFISKELFKKLGGSEIWEFRTLHNGMCYRLFFFWDSDIETLVIAMHGIVKKTNKTPVSEIEKAEKIRKEYLRNNMADMKKYPHDEALDIVLGEKGTMARDNS